MSPKLADPLYLAFKAAVAALLSVLAVDTLGVEDRLSAPFVAVVCVSPSIYGGVRRGFEQLAASVLGGGIAVLSSFWLPMQATLVFATFLTVWVAFRVRLGTAYIVGAFTVFYVLLIPAESTHITLEHRLASVFIGTVAALLMNVIVSLSRLHAVLRRRLRIAREALAQEWDRAASVLEDDLPSPAGRRAGDEGPPFDALFPLLGALQAELTDARAEGRFRSAKFRAEVDEALETARRMMRVAHYGKDLMLVAEDASKPKAAAAARALGVAIREDRPFTFDERVEPECGKSLARAARCWTPGR